MTNDDAQVPPSSKPLGERVDAWYDPCGSIMVLVADLPWGDPVEMGSEQARELAALLLRLADVHDMHNP